VVAASAERERTVLRLSLVVTTALAALATTWGWLAGSQVILLDGAYAIIGMALTWLSLKGVTGHVAVRCAR